MLWRKEHAIVDLQLGAAQSAFESDSDAQTLDLSEGLVNRLSIVLDTDCQLR
jgi:hypothetical protein